MEEWVYAGLNYDQWMEILAGTGVLLVLFCYWIPKLGWLPISGWALYIGKFIGFGLIAIPLCTRWFFSESLILTLAIIIIMIAVYVMFLRKNGI